MIFFKVDVAVRTHPRFLKAGRAAKGMWVDLMSYTREHELDGRVPKIAIATFDGTKREKDAQLAALVAVGLVLDDGEDWVLHNYVEKGNQTKEQIAKATLDNRERQARYRKNRRDVSEDCGSNALVTRHNVRVTSSSSSNSSSSLSDPEGVQGDGDGNPAWGLEPERTSAVQPIADEPEPPPAAGVTPRQIEYQRAYESGIAAGKGAPYAMPEPQRGELHRAIATFAKSQDGKSYRGDVLLRWITHTAKEFAQQVRGREATFYSAFGPRGFVRWLNEAEVGGEVNHG